MSVALRQDVTLAEFLVWEEQQELRYEFDGHAAYAMTGGTRAHAAVQANLIAALGSRLRGTPCGVFGSALKVVVAGSVRYPNAMIVGTAGDNRATIADDPVVVFEIVSESSGKVDRIDKNVEYRGTPSILRYVILEQQAVAAEIFTRSGDDWAGRMQRAGSVLRIPEAGIELPLDELYEGLDLPA